MNANIRADKKYAKRVYMRYKWIAKHEHYSKSASINADHIEHVYPEFRDYVRSAKSNLSDKHNPFFLIHKLK
ncbi:hypothetical protein [Candidatus Lokiarchaeum ossiferum]|uniref:hypothetical protein n=1 Tax=Candidatus Lokiarchaeum ossiferum TaxID=2951803 RepID=UPI00352DBDAA